jgi:hypothetical protein
VSGFRRVPFRKLRSNAGVKPSPGPFNNNPRTAPQNDAGVACYWRARQTHSSGRERGTRRRALLHAPAVHKRWPCAPRRPWQQQGPGKRPMRPRAPSLRCAAYRFVAALGSRALEPRVKESSSTRASACHCLPRSHRLGSGPHKTLEVPVVAAGGGTRAPGAARRELKRRGGDLLPRQQPRAGEPAARSLHAHCKQAAAGTTPFIADCCMQLTCSLLARQAHHCLLPAYK